MINTEKIKNNKQLLIVNGLFAVCVPALIIDCFILLTQDTALWLLGYAVFCALILTLGFFAARQKNENKKKNVIVGAATALIYLVAVPLPSFFLGNTFGAKSSVLFCAAVTTVLLLIIYFMWFSAYKKQVNVGKKAALSFILPLVLLISVGGFLFNDVIMPISKEYNPPAAISVSAEINNYENEKPIMLVAHRGLSAVAPQNTVAAFVEAGKAGCYGYEFDIRTTADDEWVVIHDDTVDSMTNGSGKVDSFTLEEIRKLKICSGNGWKKVEKSGLVIPTLDEALDVCNDYDMRPFIEIKSGSAEAVTRLLDELEQRQITNKAVIIAFDYNYLVQIHAENPEIELYFLTGNVTDEIIEQCVDIGCGLDFDGRVEKNLSYIEKAVSAGIKTGAWTIDDLDKAMKLYSMGVDTVTSNILIP